MSDVEDKKKKKKKAYQDALILFTEKLKPKILEDMKNGASVSKFEDYLRRYDYKGYEAYKTDQNHLKLAEGIAKILFENTYKNMVRGKVEAILTKKYTEEAKDDDEEKLASAKAREKSYRASPEEIKQAKSELRHQEKRDFVSVYKGESYKELKKNEEGKGPGDINMKFRDDPTLHKFGNYDPATQIIKFDKAIISSIDGVTDEDIEDLILLNI